MRYSGIDSDQGKSPSMTLHDIQTATPPHAPLQPNMREAEPPLSRTFWAMLVLTGLSAGVVGGLLMRMLFAIERLSFAYSTGGFAEGVRHASVERKLLVLLSAGVLAGVCALIAGRIEGETDLDEAIWTKSGRLPVRKSAFKALYSIVLVGMGAAVGRENALKQAGGVLGNLAASWRNLPDTERCLLVACGGGAGMAAAYNVPLGGALFAMEVLLGSFTLRAALPAFGCSLLACWTSWIFLPNQPTYTFLPAPVSESLIAWALLAGPACGLLTVPFIGLLGRARVAKSASWQVFAFPVVSLSLLGVIALWVPEMLGNGKNVVQLALVGTAPVGLLLALLFVRPLATAGLLRSGVPGGLFTPTMSLGAVAGLLLGRGWAALLPGIEQGELSTCAMIGSAAVLAAATQGPVSAAVFLLELTHTADSIMVPLLLAVVTATLVTRHFESRSIYSMATGARATP